MYWKNICGFKLVCFVYNVKKRQMMNLFFDLSPYSLENEPGKLNDFDM